MIACFIVSGKNPAKAHGGGYSTVALELEKNLKKLNVETYLISSNSKQTALPFLPFYSLRFALKIASILRNNNFEKVIIWGIGPWGFAGTLTKIFHKNVYLINNYYTSIDHEYKGSLCAINVKDYGILIKAKYILIYYSLIKLLSLIEKITVSNSNLIITNYKSTNKILLKEFNIKKGKIKLMKFSLRNIDKICKFNSNSRNYILTVARQDPRKGINFLLHAYKILADKKVNFRAIIVGDGEMLNANKKLARKLNISQYVKLIGYTHNLVDYYKKSTIFCLPSIEEGAGSISINEAMQYEIPIVSTNIDGIAEDLKHNYSALLVPPKDSKALANALEELITNPTLSKKISKNAGIDFERNHESEALLKDLKGVLQLTIRS